MNKLILTTISLGITACSNASYLVLEEQSPPTDCDQIGFVSDTGTSEDRATQNAKDSAFDLGGNLVVPKPGIEMAFAPS